MISMIFCIASIVVAITLVVGLVFGVIVLLDKKAVIDCGRWVYVVTSVAWSIFSLAAAVLCFCCAYVFPEKWQTMLFTLAGVGNLSNVGNTLKK